MFTPRLDRPIRILYNAGVSHLAPTSAPQRTRGWLDRALGYGLALAIVASLLYALFIWQPRGLLITWTTGNELDIIGFNLYRADSPDGEYVKINAQLIQGSADNVVGGEYSYLDTQVVKGHDYYYKLERIHRLGLTLPLEGPIELHAPRFPWP